MKISIMINKHFPVSVGLNQVFVGFNCVELLEWQRQVFCGQKPNLQHGADNVTRPHWLVFAEAHEEYGDAMEVESGSRVFNPAIFHQSD